MTILPMGNFTSRRQGLKSKRKGIAANSPAKDAAEGVSQQKTCGVSEPIKIDPIPEKAGWIQLAGHPNSFISSSETRILKQQPAVNSPEIEMYRALMDDPSINCCIPKFYREVDSNEKKYIELEDLLQHFNSPCALDIKMGIRTFQECEVECEELRPDLFKKMLQIDPAGITELEHQQQAVTKLRYMKFRENESSTATLGFRIEGVQMAREASYDSDLLKRLKNKKEIANLILSFINNELWVSKRFSERLKEIRTGFENSEHLKTTEVIGSSLLLLYDKSKADVWMIDFGKTSKVTHVVNHRQPWQLGNHEDGYLTGLDNLIQIMEEITDVSTK